MSDIHFTLVPVDYKKPYDEQPECRRHVIGAYANLARHNMTLAVNTIMQAIGMNTINENEIENAFSSNHRKKLLQLDNIQKVNLQKRLYRHFTFLKRMKLEDDKKKSVQLETILEVLSEFTTCMAKIRNFYTHYHPYNTQRELEELRKLKESMGMRLTYLFENTCQTLKKRDKLSHEENEVFSTQREEVRYTHFWFTSQNLPAEITWKELMFPQDFTPEQLMRELRQAPNHKRKYDQIVYTLRQDNNIAGLCHINGKKQRYTWTFSETRSDKKTYPEALKEIHDAIEKNQEKYQKDLEHGRMPKPVSDTSARIKNKKCTILEPEGIMEEWTQFDRDPNYYAAMSDPDKGLSDVGLIFFLCLFLDKSVAFDLMEEVGFTAQCTFTQDNAGENIDILQELMCMNRIRMVKAKLDSEMTETALGLDMLSELRKCPNELYKVFSESTRNEFKDDATADWEASHQTEAVKTETEEDEQPESDTFESVIDEDEKNDTAEKDTPKSTFVRWEDRFPQMALRYIDMKGLFDDIRFQLNLGKYRFTFYQHDAVYSVDNEPRLRILQKEMHGFGQIQVVSDVIKLQWKGIFEKKTVEDGLTKKDPDEAGQAPYVTEQNPQYAIDNKSHSIGLRWEGWSNEDARTLRDEAGNVITDKNGNPVLSNHYGNLDHQKMFIPYLPQPELPQDAGKQKNNAEPLLMPQCTLSLYELPAMLFYHYLLEKYDPEHKSLVEERIKSYYQNLKRFLTDVGKGELSPDNVAADNEQAAKDNLTAYLRSHYNGLRLADIPERLRKYLLSIAINYNLKLKDSAYRRLQERKCRVENALESFRMKCKRIGTKDNKFDNMRATIKTGALGQALIRDIMDWLPADSIARQRLTGQSYVALQSALSMLGQEFTDEYGNKKMVSLSSLREMMIKAQIIDEKTQGIDQKRFHPFLHLVFRDCNEETLERFYELYLEKEINKIKKVQEFLDSAKGEFAKLQEKYRFVPFLHHTRERWSKPDAQAMQKLALGYLTRPLQLPDGLFTQQIFECLQTIPQGKVKDDMWNCFKSALKKAGDEPDPAKRLANNASYLINIYFNLVEGDHSQPFYLTEPAPDGTPSPYLHQYKVFKKFYGKPIPKTNRKTTPAYTIEQLRAMFKDKESIKAMIQNYVIKEVDKYREQQERKFKRDIRKYEDRLWAELKAQVDAGQRKRNMQAFREEVKAKVDAKRTELKQMIEQYRINLTKKQERMFRRANDNERVIRRYKTQDILLFIMARSILKATSQEGDIDSNFRLKYVMDDSLLDQPIDFQWKVRVKTKEGTKTKAIEQKGMKMKDYGQFYKFASDHQRLESLLARLPEDIFLRAEIENELSYYNTNRSTVFHQVYILESLAYKLKPELMDDANAEQPWFYRIETRTDEKSGKVREKKIYIRNSFIALLEILAAGKDGMLDEEEKRLLQATRNAFGHNTYDVDFKTVFQNKEDRRRLPEVANTICDRIEEQTEELKRKAQS